MALNPETKYPTKMDPSSADYPYGTPRNISAPGAGDGTPWEMDVVKDLFALQQTLLVEAGITPSGDADTALVCQQLHAIGKVSGRAVPATTAILTTDLREAAWVSTEGYAAPNDGGGALWRATGATSPGDAGTTDFSAGLIYDLHGTEFEYAPPIVNPRAFGAAGDGVTDDTDAVQNAIRVAALATPAAGGIVYFPAGVYLCTSQISMISGVILRGAGADVSVISFAGAAGPFAGGACFKATGVASAIADFSATMTRGATALSFAAAHGLAVDDVITIYNPTANSWGPYATHYRQGEMVRVAAVPSGTTITATSPLFDAYVAANVDNYVNTPVRVGFEDLTIRGVGTTTTVSVVDVTVGRDCFVRRCKFSGSQKSLLRFDRCYGVDVRDVSLLDRTTPAGDSHGIALVNCQRVVTSGVRGTVLGALVAITSENNTRAVPTREVLVEDCQTGAGAGRGVSAAGHCEHIDVVGGTLARSVFGGDGTRWRAVTFVSDAVSAMDGGNLRGWDHVFEGCSFVASANLVGAGLITLNAASTAADTDGALTVRGCTFDLRGFTGRLAYLLCHDPTIRPVIVCRGNTLLGSGGSSDAFEIRSGGASAYWRRVALCDNVVDNAGLYLDGFQRALVAGNFVDDAPGDGIWANAAAGPPVAEPELVLHGNTVRRSWLAGIRSAIADARVHATANTSLNNRQSGSGDGNASINVSGAELLVLNANTIGDDQASPDQTRDLYLQTIATLVDAGTVRLGNLAETLSGVSTQHRFGSWAEASDRVRTSGWLELSDADADDHFSGSRDLTIGDGAGDHGISIRSSTTGLSNLRFGDSGSNVGAGVGYNHNTDVLFLRAGATDIAWLTTVGLMPAATDAVRDLGDIGNAWKEIHATRDMIAGTQLDPGGADFTLSGGWGVGAVMSVIARDGGGYFEIQAAGTPASNPSVVLTFADGAWSGAGDAFATIVRADLGLGNGNWRVEAMSNTQIRFRFIGELPIAGTWYAAIFRTFGISA